MRFLYGPRMYYSLFGPAGLWLGGKARLLRKPIEVLAAVSGVPHPLHLRLRTTDVELCRQILLEGLYDCDFPKSPRFIVDAGANIGLAAIFYAIRYPQATIVAIEPEPSNYEMLKQNVALYPNIAPLHAAVWKANQQLRIVDLGTGHTGFQTATSAQDQCASAVDGITLDKVMADFDISQIDLLKVDIEGAEKELFEHSISWIGAVESIAVEFHDAIRDGCSESVYLATVDFGFRWQNGEITYLSRVDNTLNVARPLKEPQKSTTKFPIAILGTI